MTTDSPIVVAVAVAAHARHEFSKSPAQQIRLLEGLGVEGDAHCGVTVQHLFRVAQDPHQPNLRQVHLIHSELFDELALAGFAVRPADLGENIATRGLDLLALPEGTELVLGAEATVRLTGLRNPCGQIDKFKAGLMKAVLGRTAEGKLIRKSGVMVVVVRGGVVKPGDGIEVVLPRGEHKAMEPV